MNPHDFYEQVQKEMQQRFPGFIITLTVVEKNQVSQNALVITNPSLTGGPTIYLDPFYESYQSGRLYPFVLSDLSQTIDESLKRFANDCILPSEIKHLITLDSIRYRLVGQAGNEQYLNNLVWTPYLDMAKVYYVSLPQIDDTVIMSTTITHDLCKMLQLDPNDVIKCANINTPQLSPFRLESIVDTLQDGNGPIPLPFTPPPLYVLSNPSKMWGAATVCYPGVLDKVCELLEVDTLHVLPSSIHEVLIVPPSLSQDVSLLKDMVVSTNETCVEPQDILTNEVYVFEKGKELVLASEPPTKKRTR